MVLSELPLGQKIRYDAISGEICASGLFVCFSAWRFEAWAKAPAAINVMPIPIAGTFAVIEPITVVIIPVALSVTLSYAV